MQNSIQRVLAVLKTRTGFDAVDIRQAGPIPEKTPELTQLAGAAATQLEGSVHSHTRRAVKAGATREEIYQTLLLLISTIGFPKVSAAISWAQDILNREKKKK